MPRRHSYTMRFRCPKCHRAGSAKWEEHERIALPHGGHSAILKSVSEGFRAGPQACDFFTIERLGGLLKSYHRLAA